MAKSNFQDITRTLAVVDGLSRGGQYSVLVYLATKFGIPMLKAMPGGGKKGTKGKKDYPRPDDEGAL